MTESSIPPRCQAVLEEFAGHLRVERGLSAHTVRAYVGDVTSMLDHAGRMGVGRRRRPRRQGAAQLAGPAAHLGAGPHDAGPAGRRRAGVHGVRAQARLRRPPTPACCSARPRGTARCPTVLRPHEVGQLLEADPDDGPTGLRDDAMLELLYATGIRVGELCGLDLADLDRGRRLVRVHGQGRRRNAPSRTGCRPPRRSTRWLERRPPRARGIKIRCGGVPRCARRADRSTCSSSDGSRSVG